MRYVGVDLARFVAVVGMIAAHLVASSASDPSISEFERWIAETTDTLTNGIAAPLFAVLGGVSAVFATRRALAARRVGAAVGVIALRGMLLIAIGLGLGFAVSPIIVVLAYYGAAMVIAAVFVGAPSWVLAVVAVVLTATGGTVNATVRESLGVVMEGGTPSFATFAEQPLETTRALVLTGVYPAITWVVYLLVGMLVARALLAATERGRLASTASLMATAGAAMAVAATLVSNYVLSRLATFGATIPADLSSEIYEELLREQHFGAPSSPELWAQLIASPHSGAAIDVVRTAGISIAVIGVLVAVFDGLGARLRGTQTQGARPRGIVEVLRSAGAAPLTVYTLHVLATAFAFDAAINGSSFFGDAGMPWWFIGLGAFAIHLAGVIVIGIVLSALQRRGPLEALMSGIVRTVFRT